MTNGVQQSVGPQLGPRDGLRAAAGRAPSARPIDPGPAAAAWRPRHRRGVQGRSDRGDPALEPARPGQNVHDRHLAGLDRQQHARQERRHGPAGEPGHRPALRAGRREPGRLRAGPGRVLGGRAELGDPPGPLERARQRRCPTSWRRTCGSGAPAPCWTGSSGTSSCTSPLNGAVHDAAIAAWGLKGYYDSVRPISMIRYLAGQGQSSRPEPARIQQGGHPARAWPRRADHARTRRRPAAAFASLEGHEGEIAVHAWKGNAQEPEDPGRRRRLDPRHRLGPVPAADVRDARRSPPTSRATARSAGRRRRSSTGITGSPYFPGGMGDYRSRRARSSSRPARPPTCRSSGRPTSTRRTRQAARGCGAASTSPPDDLVGREVGSQCGQTAWALAQRYYDGTAGS